mgnify:CR=1 FL=1
MCMFVCLCVGVFVCLCVCVLVCWCVCEILQIFRLFHLLHKHPPLRLSGKLRSKMGHATKTPIHVRIRVEGRMRRFITHVHTHTHTLTRTRRAYWAGYTLFVLHSLVRLTVNHAFCVVWCFVRERACRGLLSMVILISRIPSETYKFF